MEVPTRIGRSALVSAEIKAEQGGIGAGIGENQSQESTRAPAGPAGTTGTARWPEHQAPEQGAGPERPGAALFDRPDPRFPHQGSTKSSWYRFAM